MRINKLALENIGPYEQRTFEFLPKGLIGIVGPNGAGKSTIFKAAYAALTNDFSRFDDTKQGAIRDTAPEKAHASIEAAFEQDGLAFTIGRRLRPSASWMNCQAIVHDYPGLYHDESKLLSKDSEIKAELERILGVPKPVLDEHVFVRQWKMFDFLVSEPAARARLFQFLCDTSRAERIWEEAGKRLSVATPKAQTVHDNRDELRAMATEKLAQEEQLEAEIEAKEASLLSQEALEEHRKTVSAWHALQADKANFVTERAKLDRVVKEFKAAEQRKEEVEARYAEISAEYEEITKAKEWAESNVTWWQAYDFSTQRKQQLEQLLAEKQAALASAKAPEPPKGIELADKYREALPGWKLKLSESETRLRTLEADGVTKCPTCGTSVDHISLDEDRKIVEELPAKIKRGTACILAADEYAKRQAAWEKSLAARQQAVASVEEQLKECLEHSPPQPELSKEECQRRIDAWNAAFHQRAKFEREELRKTTADYAATQAAAKTIHANVKAIKERIEAATVTAEACRAAEEAIATHNGVASSLKTLREAHAAVQRDRLALLKQVDNITKAIERSKKTIDWVRRLELIREVCHRDRWPHLVVQSFLYLLEADINRTLEAFGPPFQAEAQEGLEFAVRIPGTGVLRRANVLSGGQLMLLSLAVRIAIHSRARLGLMCLDEPTAGVDKENVGYLVDALGSLGELAKDSDLQILVVTHEDRLHSVFDQVIAV